MKFEEALVYLREKKSIKHTDSQGMETILTLSELGEIFVSHTLFVDTANVIRHILFGNWEILEEPGKTFDQVFEDFKNGKKIIRKSWVKGFFVSKYDDYKFDCVDIVQNDWEVLSE